MNTALQRWDLNTPFKYQCECQFNFPFPEPVWPPELGSRGHSYRIIVPWSALHRETCQWWWGFDKNIPSMLSPSPMVKGCPTLTLSTPQTQYPSCNVLILTSMASNQITPSMQECVWAILSDIPSLWRSWLIPHPYMVSAFSWPSRSLTDSILKWFLFLSSKPEGTGIAQSSIFFLPLWNYLS